MAYKIQFQYEGVDWRDTKNTNPIVSTLEEATKYAKNFEKLTVMGLKYRVVNTITSEVVWPKTKKTVTKKGKKK